MGFRPLSLRPRSCPAADISRSLGAYPRKSASTVPLLLPAPWGCRSRSLAKVDRADEAYFRRDIAPLLDEPGIEFIGEINEQQKARFLGGARALLFPIDWPEPF